MRKLLRKFIHRFIVWYLRHCGEAFHSGIYREDGKYVVLMNEDMYHEFKKLF